LAEEILRANAKPGDTFMIEMEKGEELLKITHKAAKKKAEADN